MLLRRLNQPDLRIGKDRNEIGQPARRDHVIGVDDADDLGVRRGPLQRDAQRAGLEAFDLVLAQEFEALAERLCNAPRSAPNRHGSGVLLMMTMHSKFG